MVSLELLIDASKMPQGAQQANAALQSVIGQAKTADTAVRGVGSGLGNAFQATGGTLQVAQGINQVANSLRDLNFASAGSGISRTLLEIAKTGQDFRQLSSGVEGASGAFSALGLILRTHPLLAIASVIGAVSSAIAIFSTNTTKSATAMREARREADSFGEALAGLVNARASGGGAGSAASSILQKLRAEDLKESLQFRPLAGRDRERGGDTQFVSLSALEKVLPGIYGDKSVPAVRGFLSNGEGQPSQGDQLLLGRNALLRYLTDLESKTTYVNNVAPRPEGNVNFTARDPDPYGLFRRPDNMVDQSPEEQNRVRIEFQTKQSEDALRAMEELKDSARQVGEYLGDGIADAVLQARSLKDVVAGIANDIARSLIRQSVGNLAAGLASSFGSSGTQKSQDESAFFQ